jgi:hypothetical protein
MVAVLKVSYRMTLNREHYASNETMRLYSAAMNRALHALHPNKAALTRIEQLVGEVIEFEKRMLKEMPTLEEYIAADVRPKWPPLRSCGC